MPRRGTASVPERVATVTIEPSLRPYSALKVELLILNSEVVLIDGWNVIWFWLMSFRLMPLIWKLTESSRLPAVMNEFAPKPRLGAVRLPAVGANDAAGREHRQIEEVAAVERKLLHRVFVDDLADRDGLRLDL